MKCPNCGAEIEDGKLYCGQCGTEIQIVPEFEPEVENRIDTTLSNVATEIAAPGETALEEPAPEEPARTLRRKKSGLFYLILLAAMLILAGAVAAALYFVPAYQYDRGVSCLEKQQYDNAARRLERAVALSPNNVSYLNRLSGCYYAMEDWERAKQICQRTIALEGSNEEAYRRLVLIEEKTQDYEAISRLLADCKDREIRNLYADYLADPPEFDPVGDTYYEKQNVKLLGNVAGTVYYTLDGSEPTQDSQVYTAPIAMESGSYTLKALYVNRYGVSSSVVTQTYYIDVNVPDAPEVTPESGEYAEPCLIEVTLPKEGEVYYTLDGTTPDQNSFAYQAPLWMPAGYSTICFAVISPGGITGEVTKRQYTLNLHPVLNTEAAQNQLLLSLRSAGILSDIQGSVPGKSGKNRYSYRYPLTVNQNNYYLYREYYEETGGSASSTGNRYVVNYISGECYRIEQQADGSYKLYAIEPTTQEDGSAG